MKTKLFKKIFSQFLFLSLILIISVKKAFGAETSTWGSEVPPLGGVPVDIKAPILKILNAFIFAPLLIIGLLLYSVYFYKRIKRKDKEKRKKLFKIGTLIIFIDLILYIALIIVVEVVLLR